MVTQSAGTKSDRTISGASVARTRLGDLIDRVRKDKNPVVLEQSGEAVAALISLEDLARLQRSRYENTRIIDTIQAAFAASGLSDEELQALADEAVEWAR